LLPQPLGVVGIMVPWNYPVYLLFVPLAFAIAAGNQVLIKCSELTPSVGGLILQLISEISVLNDDISIINGDINCAKAFAALPFGHLLFTGSTAVGKQVMAAASQNLTPVTLELGGKSPAIIAESANKVYLKRLFMGKLFNAGQTCVAPDYWLVDAKFSASLEGLLRDFLNVHYPSLMTNPDYSHIISDEHKSRLIYLLDDARKKGAVIIQFGDISPISRKFPVCLLLNVNKTMQVMQEEIFGPLIPVTYYQNFADALDIIDQFPSPLALYYFGKDEQQINYLQYKVSAGAFVVNDTLTHVGLDDLPFGGVGQSGMGRYHGEEGFNTFSLLKPIFMQKKLAPISWFYPPYGKLMHFFIRYFAGIHFKENS